LKLGSILGPGRSNSIQQRLLEFSLIEITDIPYGKYSDIEPLGEDNVGD
jgi:hypothetical protein